MKQDYTKGKERARELAKRWQSEFGNASHSYAELATDAARFERLGRRFGLLREFRENGII